VRPVVIIAIFIGWAVASVFSSANSQPPDRLPELPPSSDSPPRGPYGVGRAPFDQRPATSCAAASCHGGGQVGKVGSEHSTWAPQAFATGPSDPHTKAYSVLFNSVSVQMAKYLDLKDSRGNSKVPAHQATLCLKCHAVDGANDPATRDQILSEGVGCGACHGPAEKWVGLHYTPEWKGLSNREKWDKYGFVPAGNLVARTLNCAGCHSGDDARDVNHDLYAAGHPRLAFESARFHFQPDYRKHWTEKTPQPDFEVRAWVVGQAAALRSATGLLRARADAPAGVWPEFAGYSCYSCHQKVGEGDVRGAASDAFQTRRPGVPGWEIWSNTAVGIAAEYCGAAYPGLSSPNLTEVHKLRKLMGERAAPSAKAVKEQATLALAELDAWLVAMQGAEDDKTRLRPVTPGTAERMAHAFAVNAFAKDGKLADHDWDALAANYLGCGAMFHAIRAGDRAAPGPRWGSELGALRDALRFPVPKGHRFDSPYDYDRKKIDLLRMNFERLRDATAPTGGK